MSLNRREARAITAQRKIDAAEQQKSADAQKHANASAVLGAGAKGYSQRRAAKLKQEELAKSSVRIQAKFRGKKERADPSAEANVRRERSKNDPQVQSAAYLKQHNIMVSIHFHRGLADLGEAYKVHLTERQVTTPSARAESFGARLAGSC